MRNYCSFVGFTGIIEKRLDIYENNKNEQYNKQIIRGLLNAVIHNPFLMKLIENNNEKTFDRIYKYMFEISLDNRYVNFVHFRNKNLLNDNFDITFLKKYIKLELELKLISSAFNLSDLSNIYKEIFITIVNNFDFLQTKETNILKEVLEEFDVEEFKNKHREILKTETKLDIDYIFDYSDTYKDIYIKIIEKIKNKIDIEETISLLSKIKKREVKEVNLMF